MKLMRSHLWELHRQHCAHFSQIKHWRRWLGPVQAVVRLVGVVVQLQDVTARGGCLANSLGGQINGLSKTMKLATYCIH